MGTKTRREPLVNCDYNGREKRIPKHGDENIAAIAASCFLISCEKRIPKHGDENNGIHFVVQGVNFRVKKESPNMGTKTSTIKVELFATVK